jgi:hypothetical protein
MRRAYLHIKLLQELHVFLLEKEKNSIRERREFFLYSVIRNEKAMKLSLPGYPFSDIETSSISAIASSLSPTSYRASALPTLAYSENAKSL